jgi:hypothetical protein
MENQERFLEWMLAMGNIHMASSEKMARALEVVAKSDAKIVVKKVA